MGFVFLSNAMRVVPEYQRLVVFRVGRALEKPKGPGIIFLIPILDRDIKVDLREQAREVLAQTAKTQDNMSALFAFRWYYKVIDPVKSVLEVGNFEQSAVGVANTALRSMIGDISSNEFLSQRANITSALLMKLNEATEGWGVKVTNVENLEIAVSDGQKENGDSNFTWEGFKK